MPRKLTQQQKAVRWLRQFEQKKQRDNARTEFLLNRDRDAVLRFEEPTLRDLARRSTLHDVQNEVNDLDRILKFKL